MAWCHHILSHLLLHHAMKTVIHDNGAIRIFVRTHSLSNQKIFCIITLEGYVVYFKLALPKVK